MIASFLSFRFVKTGWTHPAHPLSTPLFFIGERTIYILLEWKNSLYWRPEHFAKCIFGYVPQTANKDKKLLDFTFKDFATRNVCFLVAQSKLQPHKAVIFVCLLSCKQLKTIYNKWVLSIKHEEWINDTDMICRARQKLHSKANGWNKFVCK